jgi:mevalonate kinase
MNVYSASVPSKVILTGEHAVVYGSLAVAGSIDIRNSFKLTVLDDPYQVKILIDGTFIELVFSMQTWPDVLALCDVPSLVGVLSTMVAKCYPLGGSFSFEVITKVPIGAGLGSSASFCVGVAAVLLVWHIQKSQGIDDLQQINQLAFIGENLLHGKASGLDNAVVTYGGIITYRSGVIHRIHIHKPLKILIVDSKTPKNTKVMVENLKQSYERHKSIFVNLFESINSISESFATYIEQEKYDEAIEIMSINHNILKCLEVTSEVLDKIISVGLKHNLKGKMTGGGGGGVCIFIIENQSTQDFIEECHTNGWETIATEVTNEGVVATQRLEAVRIVTSG